MSSLCTVEDIEEHLGLAEPWQVRRLIARLVLRANPDASGKYKATEDEVAAVLSKNTPQALSGPKEFQNWIDSRLEGSRADTFRRQIVQQIIDSLPDRDPGGDQRVLYRGMIRSIGESAPPPVRFLPSGAQEHLRRYRTFSEVYATHHLRMKALQVVRRLPASLKMRNRSLLEQLYASPKTYRNIVAEAWGNYQDGGVRVRARYKNGQLWMVGNDVVRQVDREPYDPNKPVPVNVNVDRTFVLLHADIKGERDRIATLAF